MSGGGPDTCEREYSERLACGTPVAELLAQIADDSPPSDPAHQQACPHCQSQLAQLATVWKAVHRLAAERVIVPASFEAGVRRRIIEAPAAGATPSAKPTPRPRAWVPIPSDGHGTTRVSDTVLARLARLAARSVPGVSVTSGFRSSGASVTVTDGQVVVGLHIQAPYGDDVAAAADAVRMAVVVQLWAVAGLEEVRVDITIVGLGG